MFAGLIELKRRDVPWRVALRNTVAVVMPLAIGLGSGYLAAGIAVAIGALNTMFSDQPGPYRLRARRLLFATAAAGLSALVGALLGDVAWALTLAALTWGIGGGLLVALGPEAGRTGMISMVLLVVMAADPAPMPDALVPAGLIVTGGLLQTVFALAAWPLQRYRPERHALASVFSELSTMARSPSDPTQAPPSTATIQFAQDLLHGAHRSRSVAVQSFRILAAVAERARIELLALGDLRSQLREPRADKAVGEILQRAAPILAALAVALRSASVTADAQRLLEGIDEPLQSLAGLITATGDRAGQRLLKVAHARANGLAAQLRSAVRNANFAGSAGETRAQAIESALPEALRQANPWAILRANLSLTSMAFRHALRCGVCIAAAVAVERGFQLPHGYWLPMTTAIVLKPDFAGTFSFGMLRVAGTLIGLLLATALLHVAFNGEWERLFLLAALCFGFRMLATVNYAVGTAALTGLIVILQAFDGEAPAVTMLPRAIETVLGSLLALAAYALWPTREARKADSFLADMIEAYRNYLDALLNAPADAWADTRLIARASRTNAQASLDRLSGELRRDRDRIARAETVFANGNRIARACMALEAVLIDEQCMPQREAIRAFGTRMHEALTAMAASIRNRSPLAPLDLRGDERVLAARLDGVADDDPQSRAAIALAHAIDRITEGIDTLAHVIDPSAMHDHDRST